MALRLRRGTDAERQQPGFIPESGELIYTTDTKLVYIGDGVTEGGLPISSGAFATSLITDLSPQLGGDLDLNTYQITGAGAIDITGSISSTGAISSSSTISASTSITTPSTNTDVITADTATAIALGSNVDLNGNNIIGTGNINIDGTINATGNINLGDSTDDNITVAGAVASNLIPAVDSLYNIGSASFKWQTGYFNELNVDTFSPDQITVGDILSQDSTLLYNSANDQLSASIGVFDDLTLENINKFGGGLLYDGLRDVFLAEEFEGIHRGSVIGDDSTIFFDSLSSTATVNTLFVSTLFSEIGDAMFIGSDEQPAGIELRYEGIRNALTLDTTVDTDSFIEYRVSRGSLTAKEVVQPGDLLSGSLMTGWTGTDYVRASGVIGQVDPDGVVSGTTVPGRLVFINADSAGNDVLATFNGAGVFEAPILKTGEYASATQRDSTITSPSTGSIIFVTENNRLQFYNGTNWADISNVLTDIEDVVGTAYTVSAADIGKLLTFRDAGAVTVTLPDAADTSVPVGAYVEIANMDATNPISIAGTASQVVSKAAGAPSVPGFGSVKAVKLSTSEWLVTGDTA